MAAARRWRRVIIGDIANQAVNIGAGVCGIPHSAIVETIDDLLILMQVTSIDGAGGILGQAGVCARRSGFGFPVVGFMQIDVADLDALVAAGTAESVVAHEIGHTLGVGTDWSALGLLTGGGGADPFFTGALALSFASLALVYYFWATARLAVLVGLALAYAVAFGGVVWGLCRFLRRQPRPFVASLQELEEDRACLREES